MSLVSLQESTAFATYCSCFTTFVPSKFKTSRRSGRKSGLQTDRIFATRARKRQSKVPLDSFSCIKCLSSEESKQIHKGLGDDFDREYFDDLKAEFSSDSVRIFSKDDYELDKMRAPAYFEFRGRDVDEILKRSNERPIPPGLSFAPLHLTDLHTEEEIASFDQTARDYDPVSGREWIHPPPESAFAEDKPFDDLWSSTEDLNSDDCEESDLEQLAFEPRRAKKYDSEEEEIAALRQAFEDLEEKQFNMEESGMAFGDFAARPTDNDLETWHNSSAERGGNSTKNESWFLSPFSSSPDNEFHSMSKAQNSEKLEPPVPPQFTSLANVHTGSWRGVIHTYALSWDVNNVTVSHYPERKIQSQTDRLDFGVSWSSIIEKHEQDSVPALDSKVSIAFSDPQEELCPNRAIFANGSFLAQHFQKGEQESPDSCFSLQKECISTLTNCDQAVSAVEVCFMRSVNGKDLRARVFLCTKPDADDAKSSGRSANMQPSPCFSHIIAISETRDHEKNVDWVWKSESKSASAPEVFFTKWTGEGLSLHPFYPPVPTALASYQFEMWRTETPIQPGDVTWTEEDFNSMTAKGSHGKMHGAENRKKSKRVLAAWRHDVSRLSECSILMKMKVGDAPSETHAWKWADSSKKTLYSPRLGKFIGDYFGIVLPGNLLLTAPAGDAWPKIHNTICVMDFSSLTRTSLLGARSPDGDLVGALYVTEQHSTQSLREDPS